MYAIYWQVESLPVWLSLRLVITGVTNIKTWLQEAVYMSTVYTSTPTSHKPALTQTEGA